ncbi:MAG: MFS transporter [Candidatus Hodarchaeota archaeon]
MSFNLEEVEFETVTSKRNVFFWAMYDLANTIYSMVIVSLIISRYVLVIGQLEHGLTYGEASFIFGSVESIMAAGIAICVPILGALSDTAGKRKPYVISLTGIILLFASLIGFFHNIAIVLLFYVIANMAYNFSLTFYDAMLPFIAKKEDIGKVAGFGVAWGYLGTIISLFILMPFIFSLGDVNSIPPLLPEDDPVKYGYTDSWIPFILPMILFLVFAIPFLFVHEKQKKGGMPSIGKLIKGTFKQLKGTFKDIKKHRPMFIFIFGYFFISDIANVIVLYMMQLVTDGLVIGTDGNPSDTFGIIYIIIATISAVIFTYFMGKFGERYGGKNTFYLVGALWLTALAIGVILIFVFPYINIGLNIPFIFSLMIGIIAGPALGGTWTAQRIMVTELAPKEKFGEYFGFSKLSGRVSSSIGPLIFGAILLTYDIIGKSAYGWALISGGVVMGIGLLIISFVDVSGSNK